MANNDNSTPITSISPPDSQLFKAYLQYRDVKQQLKKYKKPQKYKITIELSISSNSAEYSAEDSLDDESETAEKVSLNSLTTKCKKIQKMLRIVLKIVVLRM